VSIVEQTSSFGSRSVATVKGAGVPQRKREQKRRWFRNGQKWRTGCEGRISVAKRRDGLRRCRYKGYVGMHRWVGLGVIADNLNQHRARHGKAGSPLSHHDLRQAR
jgi:hypothetical protein